MTSLITGRDYRLVVRKDVSMLHNDPATEQCNLDDSKADVKIDDLTAARVIEMNEAKLCQYCFPDQ